MARRRLVPSILSGQVLLLNSLHTQPRWIAECLEASWRIGEQLWISRVMQILYMLLSNIAGKWVVVYI